MSASLRGEEHSPRPRADAARNRSRIVEVARAALAGDGETTMQAIARASGVGQGTIYRHFPTREALLLEVFEADFDDLVASVYAAAADPHPAEAMRIWLEKLAVFGRMKHALAPVLEAATRAELAVEQYDRMIEAIETLLTAGVAAGELRADLCADEVLPLVSFLWHLDTRVDPRIPHLLEVVVDGMRPQFRRAP